MRKLWLDISPRLSYSDFFRPLVLPNLEKFAFDTSNGDPVDLRQAIECLCLPNLRLELDTLQPDIVLVARSLPPLTTINAPDFLLLESVMDIISHDPCFQKLTSLQAVVPLEFTKAFIEMLTVQWSRARQVNIIAPRNTICDDLRLERQKKRHLSTFPGHQAGSKTVGSFGLENHLL